MPFGAFIASRSPKTIPATPNFQSLNGRIKNVIISIITEIKLKYFFHQFPLQISLNPESNLTNKNVSQKYIDYLCILLN